MNKLFFLRWLALLSLIVWGATLKAETLPLNNPGFEGTFVSINNNAGAVTGLVAPGWSDNSSFANVKAVYSVASTGAHGGATAQQIDVTTINDGAVQFIQPVSLTTGYAYRANFWLKGKPGTRVSIRLQADKEPYGSYAYNSITLTDTWTLYSAEGYVTETAGALFLMNVETPGTVLIDDVSFERVAGAPTASPPKGAVSREFFGLHLTKYLRQTMRNNGFEGSYTPINNAAQAVRSGSIAQGWVDNSEWATVKVAYSADTTSPRSGKSAQKVQAIEIAPDSAVQLAQPIDLIPNRSYTFSVWLKGDPGATVNLVVQNGEKPYQYYAFTPVTLTSTWTKVSTTADVAGTGTSLVMIQAKTPVTFWADDAQVLDANNQAANGASPFPTVPFGTLRLWDSGVLWRDLEPLKGKWNWESLDAFVAAAKANGNPNIILTLGQSPEWASARPTEYSYNGQGAPAEPRSMRDWRNYVRKVAERYKGQIRHFEIWNEPNDNTFYSGTVAKLVQLTREARAVLKSVDANNLVLAPPAYSAGYLDQYLAAGGASLIDIVSYHVYATPPETGAAELANVRLVMAKNKVNLPLWNSEGASGDGTTPPELFAAYLARKYLVDLAYGATNFNWYFWGPATTYALPTVTNDAIRSPTTAGVAFAVLTDWLVGATVKSVTTDAAGTWQMSIISKAGVAGVIVWNANASVATNLPSGFTATKRLDLAGNTVAASGNAITATIEPALFNAR